MSPPRPPVSYRYVFTFPDGTQRSFDVTLDGDALAFQRPAGGALPEWTRLGFHQCPNCPLSTAAVERCPVAVNLVDIVEAFKDRTSFDSVEVTVESRNRA